MPALVIDGHPDPRSLTAALAQRYALGHGEARVIALRDLEFDPHLRFGYRERMPLEPDLEPDLADAKRALGEAQTVVIATPLWWGSVPALLKGFFDRALLPQQEYRYSKRGIPQGLLSVPRGRLLLLADTPWFVAPFTGLPAQTHVARNTMRLCGIRSVRTHRLLGVKGASPIRIARWLDRAETLGSRDARASTKSSARPGERAGGAHAITPTATPRPLPRPPTRTRYSGRLPSAASITILATRAARVSGLLAESI